MKKYAEKFYKSKTWQKTRATVWQRDKGLCQECYRKGIVKAGDTVHHIVPITPSNINDANVTLNPDNLETLCRDCHAKMHGRGGNDRYSYDEMGRVIITE